MGLDVSKLGQKARDQIREQLAQHPKPFKARKYRNVPTLFKSTQGFERRYDSKKEAAHAMFLDSLVDSGRLSYWLPQIPIPLPGGVSYRADFLLHWSTGYVGYQDVKGRDTQASKNKRKQVKAIYRIDVEIV